MDTNHPPIYLLNQVRAADREHVGPQGVYLAEQLAAGLPVTPLLVCPRSVLVTVLQQNPVVTDWLATLDLEQLQAAANQPQTLQTLADELQLSIAAQSLAALGLETIAPLIEGEGWQVPSLRLQPWFWRGAASQSATAPVAARVLAGPSLVREQFCWRNLSNLAEGIRHLLQSLFQARNLFWFAQNRLSPTELGLAIAIQPTWATAISGFLLPEAGGWALTAIPGLSHALLEGEVTPDRYRVEYQDGQPVCSLSQRGHQTYRYDLENAGTGDTVACIRGQALPSAPRQEHQFGNLSASQVQFLLDQVPLNHTPLEQVSPTAALGLEWGLGPTLAQIDAANPETVEATKSATQFQITGVQPLDAVTVMTGVLTHPTRQESEPGTRPGTGEPLTSGLPAAPGQTIAPALVLSELSLSHQPGTVPRGGQILVLPTLPPEGLGLLQSAVGLICETGGMTSHAAILARELGLPAVVGATGATRLIQSGQWLLLDGDQGQVYPLATRPIPSPVQPTTASSTTNQPRPDSPAPLPSLRTRVMLNLSQLSRLPQALSLPVAGVGLLRAELMMVDLLAGEHPYRWLQQGRQSELLEQLTTRLSEFATAFSPRPVFYRSLDLRSHDWQHLQGGTEFEPSETNPMLGQRGVYRYRQYPELFDLELTALARVNAQQVSEQQINGQQINRQRGRVQLILPFVRSVSEVEFCRQRLEQVGLWQNPDFQLWIMAEVPSVLFLLPEYQQVGVRGIAIGTNDLTQLLLGVDRDQPDLASTYDERHPAVRAAISQLITSAQELGLDCCLCGEAPIYHPEWITWLVEAGIPSISVSPEFVLPLCRALATAEANLLPVKPDP